MLEHWGADVWNWLTGIDPTTHQLDFLPNREFPSGVPIIWTTDERDNDHPVKPWPGHLEYLRYYTAAAVSTAPEDKIIFIDKSRQMLASTGLLLAWDWWCRNAQARRILWSKLTQEQAADMLNEKVRAVDQRLPPWVREHFGASATPQHRIRYKLTGSQFIAVNEKAAQGAARGGTATAIGVDEAAYQDYFARIVEAALPMAAKLAALTTAAAGPPDSGAGFFFTQIKPGRIYRAAKPLGAR